MQIAALVFVAVFVFQPATEIMLNTIILCNKYLQNTTRQFNKEEKDKREKS